MRVIPGEVFDSVVKTPCGLSRVSMMSSRAVSNVNFMLIMIRVSGFLQF